MDSSIPLILIAGDTWQWERDLPDYPAPIWTLTYSFKNACESPDNIVAVANGTKHLVTVTPTVSAEFEPGQYRAFGRVTSGSVAHTVDDVFVQIQADPLADGAQDFRTYARRLLDAVESALEKRATRDQLAMSVAGRSISRHTLKELIELRDKLRSEVASEEASNSGGKGRDILVRMRRA